MDFETFVRLLQLTISPMVLISAVGLLLLSTTNRMARVIDRSRALQEKVTQPEGIFSAAYQQELQVLLGRCEILRWSIGMLVFSIITAVFMILLLVVNSVFWALVWHTPIVVFLIISVLAILLAEVLFLYDISLSLKALKIAKNGGNRSPNGRQPTRALGD